MEAHKLKTKQKAKSGVVYLLSYVINGIPLYKIGFSTSSIDSRIKQIKYDHNRQYSTVIELSLVGAFDCEYPNLVEHIIHLEFNKYRVNFGKICEGYTELFSQSKVIERFFKDMAN